MKVTYTTIFVIILSHIIIKKVTTTYSRTSIWNSLCNSDEELCEDITSGIRTHILDWGERRYLFGVCTSTIGGKQFNCDSLLIELQHLSSYVILKPFIGMVPYLSFRFLVVKYLWYRINSPYTWNSCHKPVSNFLPLHLLILLIILISCCLTCS